MNGALVNLFDSMFSIFISANRKGKVGHPATPFARAQSHGRLGLPRGSRPGNYRDGTLRETDSHWYLMSHATGREQRVTWFSMNAYDHMIKVIDLLFSS